MKLEVDVNVYVHGAHEENQLLKLILSKLEKTMATLDDVVTKVTALGTVEDSVVALLTDLKAKLDAAIAAGADPAKLQALSDALGAQTQRLSDAVTANTPAA
jgi:hypothetical protein